MFEKLQRLAKRRTYEGYWKAQLGTTVRITRGALEGQKGRLNALCSPSYGIVALHGGWKVCVIYSNLEVER